MSKEITISATMSLDQAEAMSEFFKRMGHNDYLDKSDLTKPKQLESMKRGANRIRPKSGIPSKCIKVGGIPCHPWPAALVNI
jgi:hypothetical protein